MRDTVLVTGAGGYLGSGLLNAFRSRGISAVGLIRESADLPPGFVACDLANATMTKDVVARIRPRLVVHAAASVVAGSGHEALQKTIADNVIGSASLIAACGLCDVEKIIACSTVEVYGPSPVNDVAHAEDDPLRPYTAYGHSKVCMEHLLESFRLAGGEALILRMPGIHGGPRRSGIVHGILHSALRGGPIKISEPNTRLSFLFYQDAIDFIVRCSESPGLPEPVYNLANGASALSDLAVMIARHMNAESKIEFGSGEARNRTLDRSRLGTIWPEMPSVEERLVDLIRSRTP